MYQPKVIGLKMFELFEHIYEKSGPFATGPICRFTICVPNLFSRVAKLRIADLQFADHIFVEDLKLP
jgi:hypothetical protein